MLQSATAVEVVPSPLQILDANDQYIFHLTGSRCFGDAEPSSDYDFFVQDDGTVEAWLMSKGFVKITDPIHGYAMIPDTKVYRNWNVDVQVRKNAAQFERVNRWLEENHKAYLKLKTYDKQESRVIWNFLFHVLS